MFGALIQLTGVWFLVAIAVQAVTVFVEQAGAARSPDEDTHKPSAGAVALLAVSALTPGLLLAHGYFATHANETLRLVAIAAPIAGIVLGALLGALFGAVAPGAAPLMRKLALPLALVSLALTIFAAWPAIQLLINAAQSGGVIVAP